MWGWHRLALPAFIPAPSHEPARSTQALPELEMPPDLTLLPGREQGVWQSRRKVSPSSQLLQESSTQPCALQHGEESPEEEDGEDMRCWREESQGRAGSDRTSEQAAISGEMPMLLV